MGRISQALTRMAGATVWSGIERRAFSRDESRLDAYCHEPEPVAEKTGDTETADESAGSGVSGIDDQQRCQAVRLEPRGRGRAVAPQVTPMPSPDPELPLLTRVPERDPEKLFDIDRIIDHVTFVGRAMLRHAVLSFVVFSLTLGGIAGAALAWPKSWGVDAKLLVRHNDVMSSLVNPGRTIPREKSTTTAAEELVLRRDNLVAIVEQANLVEEWERTRTPLLRAKDRLFAMLRGVPTRADRVDGLVGLLERDLHVNTEPNGVVNVWVFWRDPHLAAAIVDRAIENFLRDRRERETSAIADSIAILDQSAQVLEAEVAATVAELGLRARPEPRLALSTSDATEFVGPMPPAPPAPQGPSPELTTKLARTRAALENQRQQLARLDGQRRQELTQAQTKLAAAETVYTEDYPTVVALRQNVAALSRPSPDEQAAIDATSRLEQELDTLSAAVLEATQVGEETIREVEQTAVSSRPAPLPVVGLAEIEAARADPVQLRLQVELAQLTSIRDRASAARAELASSQAGFKHQYAVVRPPRAPLRPASPNMQAIFTAGVIASLLLAVLSAVGADLLQGRIVEPWQVERLVGIPVTIRTANL